MVSGRYSAMLYDGVTMLTRGRSAGITHWVRRERVHTSDGRSLAGTSLAAEASGCPGEESRLKAGCSQDWLPHKRRINNPPQVGNLPHKARGFLGRATIGH